MLIKFDNVYFRYGKKDKLALNKVNLTVDKSEIVFIMGHTGSGKSTLVQHINGLLKCNEGNVEINIANEMFVLNHEKKETNIKKLRKCVGLVFQFPEYQLFETSVIRDVMFGPMNFYNSETEAKEMAIKALDKVGIDDSYYERSPFELSGGEKRKIAIAGVLASNPDVIIMDEPTSSLDSNASKEIMNLVCKLKDEGKIVIVISHDTDLCYEYADRVIIMHDGKIVKDEDVESAFDDEEILEEAKLIEPFVHKVKKSLNIKDKIRTIEDLKEVINNG